MACGSGLELVLLNEQLGNQGILVNGQLRFYTAVLLYGVTFGPSGSYMIEKLNRFNGNWETVEFSGTLKETTDTLNLFGPFLSANAVNQFWGGVSVPLEGSVGGDSLGSFTFNG